MKQLLTSLLLFLLLGPLAHAQSKFDQWPELKTFHAVMSATFHPSEEGNLEPIKSRIAELVTKAESLAASKVPAAFKKKEVTDATQKLASDGRKLQELIRNKETDEVIKKSLTDLHDTFHFIVEKCSAEHEPH